MAGTKTLTLRAAYDFAVTALLRADLRVAEYAGNGRSVAKAVRAGARVTITYHRRATNCGVHVYRRDNNTVIGRDFVATPADVLAATGIDVTAACTVPGHFAAHPYPSPAASSGPHH